MRLGLTLASLVLACVSSFAGAYDTGPRFSISLEDVEKILNDHPSLRTGEDFLAKLPKQYLKHPLLMYQSQSLQAASVEFPRVIAMGSGEDELTDKEPDRLFMAFNGSPSQANYDTFELIQFRAKAARHEFAKIVFAPGKRPVLFKSPPECIRCHDYPSRPNWSPYPFWPGAYSSEDGLASESEIKNYDTFVNRGAKQGRYRYLDLPDTYFMTHSDYSHVPPSKRLADILHLQEGYTVAAAIKRTRHYEAYRYAIAGAMAKCSNLESFFPQPLRERLPKTYAQVLDETRREQMQSYLDRVAAAYKLTGKNYPRRGDEEINFNLANVPFWAGLRFVLERDGGSISPLVYSFDRRQWSVSRGSMILIEHFMQDYSRYQGCDKLREQSVEALTKLWETDPSAFASGVKTQFLVGDRNAKALTPSDRDLGSALGLLQNACAKCHAPGGEAMPIPLSDPGALAVALRSAPTGRASTEKSLYQEWLKRIDVTDDRRMPPDRSLSKEEVQAMTNYLKELVSHAR